MQQICRRTPMPKCDFNKAAKQLYWNHTSVWVFSCKFAAYFQNSFSLRTALNGCFHEYNQFDLQLHQLITFSSTTSNITKKHHIHLNNIRYIDGVILKYKVALEISYLLLLPVRLI